MNAMLGTLAWGTVPTERWLRVRVLVVEDQLTSIQKIRQMLAPEGFEIDACETVTEAESHALVRSYDLILLSVALPEDQGFTLLHHLRRSGLATPILAMSDSGTVADRVRCLDMGADGYVAHAIHGSELVARIRALVRRHLPDAETVIRIHDLEIDTVDNVVRRAGQSIRLTRREYALLLLLARNRGKVCTRAMIWQHLYDPQTTSTSNVVDAFIRLLRVKIDRGFGKRLIVTRWGEGYMLRDEQATD